MANYSNHSNYFKPDSALKRSEELINVGQKLEALQVLREVVTARRFRAWQKSHETILFKYVELCVDLKKGWIAKDGLIQYRNSCQIVNISSLEDVIKHFLHLATERTELARSKAQSLEEALDVDDLEADARPEDLMLSSVTSEKGKDRSDRELVTPCFKFLWETYKTVLEVLKNNSKLETLYAMTAHRAFQFCKQYKRTREFHRLCDTIRYHLTNLNKFRDQRDRPDLSAPESLQLYLDTRFEQLKIATELELWQEAFRSVEDIHGLMCMVKKTPKPALMVIYYSKLTEIFRVSSSHLHHAYAWFKLFSLQKSYNKNLSQKAMQLIASSVVLAALSVPPYDHTHGLSHLELENEKERNLKMFNLIGFHLEPKVDGKEVLSRSSLLSELVSKGVMNCATPEVKDLYNLLENDFPPLDFASKVQPLLTKISKTEGKLSSAPSLPEVQLSQYIPSLEKTATLKLLLQVSHSYKTMKIERLSSMIPFFDFSVVERISVDAVKHNFISLKVDHTRGAILFGNLGLASAGLQDHVAAFSESLNSVRSMIYPATEKRSKLEDMLMGLQETVNKEHKRVLARKSIIEKRKEAQECHLLEMEREEVSKRLKLQKITEEAEKKRLASEYEERKNQRIRREIEQRELEEAQALLQEAEKRSKKKGKKPIIEAEKVTKQTLMDLALSEQLRERQESEKKLQKLAKTMDHLERAKREEAAPLIEAAFQIRLVEEKMLHELEQQQETTLSRQCHDGDLREKNRLSRMLEDKMIFQERVISRRQEEFNRLKIEREERMQQIIHQRKQERETRRKLLFHARMEEENRKRMEEEEEVRRREAADKRRREEAEHRAKLDEIAKKQRQRELELEEKEKIRREGLLGRSSEVPSRTSVLPPGGGIPLESGMPATTVAAVAGAAAPPDGPAAAPLEKYIPRHKRGGDRHQGSGPAAPTDPDRWGRRDDHLTAFSDRRRSDDSRTAFGGGVGSRPSTYSSRYNSRG